MSGLFCTVCFDAQCQQAASLTSQDHMKELEHERLDAAYAALKHKVVAAGDSVIEVISHSTRATFFSTMQRNVDEQAAARTKALAAELSLQRFLDSAAASDTASPTREEHFAAAEKIAAALSRVREAVLKERKEFDRKQTGGESSSNSSVGEEKDDKQRALDAYGAALEEAKSHVKVASGGFAFPWRLGYYVELKQSFLASQQQQRQDNEAAMVNFEGGTITDANGDPLWDVCCRYCGIRIQQGAFGEGVKRVVLLDSADQHAACLQCYDMLSRILREVPAAVNGSSSSSSSSNNNTAIIFAPPDPVMHVVETDEPTMMRVAASAVASTHHIAHWLQKTFCVFSKRPALGWRTNRDDKNISNSNKNSVKQSSSSPFSWITYHQLHVAIARLSNLFCELRESSASAAVIIEGGYLARAYVGISSMNRWEFVAADMAAAFAGWVSIGIHTTYTEEELREVMRHVRLPVIVCDGAQVGRFLEAAYQLQQHEQSSASSLKVILCMDDLPCDAEMEAMHAKRRRYDDDADRSSKIRVMSLRDLFRLQSSSSSSSSLSEQDAAPPPLTSPIMQPNVKKWSNVFDESSDAHDDEGEGEGEEGNSNLFSCIFTSGSSGSPKGVLHTERSFASDVGHALNIRPLCSLSFIPLSHSTDRMRVYETLLNGGRVAFVAYDHRNWLDHELATGRERFELLRRASERGESDNGVGQMLGDVWELQPTVFISPPRVWKGMEFIFKQHVEMKKKALQQCSESGGDIEAAALQDVMLQWKRGPFAKIVTCATGGGPTDKSSFDFVRNVAGVPLLESYGATECGGIAISVSGEHRAFMDVLLSDGVEIKLLDEITGNEITELRDGDDSSSALVLRGEALIHTKHVTPSYLRNREATEHAIYKIDGKLYFRSGDIVEAKVVKRNGAAGTGGFSVVAVRVVDRKKNMLQGLRMFKITTPATPSGEYDVDSVAGPAATCSAEALEATATLLPGAMHAAAIPRNVTGDYVLVVSVPGDSAASPRPRMWTAGEKQHFLRVSRTSSEAQHDAAAAAVVGGAEKEEGRQRWLYPMPAAVIIDNGAGWAMNTANRKNGLLTVSSKVNRAAVAKMFEKEINQVGE